MSVMSSTERFSRFVINLYASDHGGEQRRDGRVYSPGYSWPRHVLSDAEREHRSVATTGAQKSKRRRDVWRR